MYFNHSLKLMNDKNTSQSFVIDRRATCNFFNGGAYGKWVGVDNAGVKQSQIKGKPWKRQAGAKALPAVNRPAFSCIAVELRQDNKEAYPAGDSVITFIQTLPLSLKCMCLLYCLCPSDFSDQIYFLQLLENQSAIAEIACCMGGKIQ